MRGKRDKGLGRKARKVTLLLVFSAAALFLNGCGNFRETEISDVSEETENDNLIKVGFSQIGSESVWRTANTASIQGALTRENGFFLLFSNARQKQENQIKAIRSFISQRLDYIVFAPVTEDGWDTVLEEARDAGIPVIVVDRMVDVEDESLYETFVGTDKTAEGRNAGLWLEQYLEEQGRSQEKMNIVVLQGTIGSTSEIGRTQGFLEVAEKHENWLILEQKSADFTTAKGEEVMEQFIRKYPGIHVVVAQNDDMAFGALTALEKAGMTTGTDGDVILISFDAVKDALELVSQGKINADIECNPNQGEYLAEIIKKLERGETVDKINNIDENVFTVENVDQYLADRMY